jgi:hypothetical protein
MLRDHTVRIAPIFGERLVREIPFAKTIGMNAVRRAEVLASLK